MTSLILDAAIISLLVIALGAGYQLHRKLTKFRVDTKEFETLILALDNAAKRAEAALGNLRQIGENVGTKLTEDADKTQGLLDELNFMTKRADQLADTLEGAISSARKHEQKRMPTSANARSLEPSDVPKLMAQDQRRRAPDLEKRLKTLK